MCFVSNDVSRDVSSVSFTVTQKDKFQMHVTKSLSHDERGFPDFPAERLCADVTSPICTSQKEKRPASYFSARLGSR